MIATVYSLLIMIAKFHIANLLTLQYLSNTTITKISIIYSKLFKR